MPLAAGNVRTPRVGGSFVTSVVTGGRLFQFNEKGSPRQETTTVFDRVYEIISFSYGGLYLIDHSCLKFAVLADYHFCYSLSGNRDSIAFLLSREVAISDFQTMLSWEIPVEQWFDFEDSNDLSLEITARIAARLFGPECRADPAKLDFQEFLRFGEP